MTQTTVTAAATVAGQLAPRAIAGSETRHRGAIFHPVVDLLCLGGASLVLLPALLAVPEASLPAFIAFSFVLADVINHPHFAASYQIFYRGFAEKAFGSAFSRGLWARYVFAGLVVPGLLIVFFAYAFTVGDAQLLGWGGNLMLLFVGWHYTKQGYGMLIVDSVFTRRFFSDAEKTVFRYNAYACWMSLWLTANWYVSERELWGLAYYSLPVPAGALLGVGGATLVTTILTFGIFARRMKPGGGGLPVAGTVAYVTSLYVWLAARFAPATVTFVAAFHSLQYLLIVSRYEINRSEAMAIQVGGSTRTVIWSLARFVGIAVLLGLIGFWWAPTVLEMIVPYDHAALGSTAFLFMFWIFINVHHYFIDNVIWRRDNPETGAFLFGAKTAKP